MRAALSLLNTVHASTTHLGSRIRATISSEPTQGVGICGLLSKRKNISCSSPPCVKCRGDNRESSVQLFGCWTFYSGAKDSLLEQFGFEYIFLNFSSLELNL